MAQSSSGSNPGRPPQGQSVAEMFRSLQELVGDWNIDQVVFVSPSDPNTLLTTPVTNIGRMTCRSLISGVAILVITEIPAAGVKTSQLITFNPSADRFELALVDTTSEVGILLFTGQPLMTRSSEEIRAQFGKVATAIREWTLVQPTSGLPETATVRIVENEISENLWVNQLFMRGAHGEVLAEQQVLTRVQAGCAPQLGCELGCAGLVGCQAGCAGIQGPNGLPQGMAPVMGQAALCGQAQLIGAPSVMGQAQLCGQASLIGVPQLMAPLPLVFPAPLIGQTVCTAAPAPACPRAPVPPPRHPVPGRPGHPHK